MTELEHRASLCEIGRRLWQRGLVGATEGNLSVRLNSKFLLCTPSGLSKGHMKPDEIVVIDYEGVPQDGGVPSSEIKLHLAMYRGRSDCMAVIHAHPPTATGFTLAQHSIPDDVLPEAAMVLGPVASVPFAFPGTDEVPDSIGPFLKSHKTFLLSHHGAAVMGKNLVDAYHRMETLERIARIVMTARLLGKIEPLPPGAVEALREEYLNGDL